MKIHIKFWLWFFGLLLILAAVVATHLHWPPVFRAGEVVLIKDCIIWSESVPADGNGVTSENGIQFIGSPGVMMRSGHPIGETKGIVVGSRQIARNEFLRPVYEFTVEFSYTEEGEGKLGVEKYYAWQLSKLPK